MSVKNISENVVSDDSLEQVSGGLRKKGTVMIVNCERRCNCRRGPGSTYARWGFAYAGKTYDFYGWVNNWAQLNVDGSIKYVFKDFILEL